MKKGLDRLFLSSVFLVSIGVTHVDASDFDDYVSEKNNKSNIVETDYVKKDFTYNELNENVDTLLADQPETYAKIALDFAKGYSPDKEFRVS